ncbi:hypothetical protein SAVIM338S_03877 [Streptomyces avidinii]
MRRPRWLGRGSRPPEGSGAERLAREAPPREEAPRREELLVFGLEGFDADPREAWRARERMAEEASDLLDRRLDLTRDAAPWNVATFATLTAASAAVGATVALTGPAPWWMTLAPWILAAAFLGLTAVAVRQLRAHAPRPPRRARRPFPDDQEMPLYPAGPGEGPAAPP